MDFLEFSYTHDISKQQFLARNFEILPKHIQIVGAPKTGTTSFVLHYLQGQKKGSYLLLDLHDLRCDVARLDLQSFIEENQINIVVIDNYEGNIEIPQAKQVIVITKKNYLIRGFETIFFRPLCFEEFLLFDKKHQNITASFNYFLKFGNLPETIIVNDFQKISALQTIIRLIARDKNELLFLKKIFSNAAQIKSIFQLYSSLKKEMKVSKDRFYEYCNYLLAQKIIFFIPKYNQPKISPKIMLYNHAFLDAVTTKKFFNNSFENMVFLELLTLSSQIYYLDGVHFYLPSLSLIVLSIPFFNQLSLGKNTSKLLEAIELYNVQEIKIITVATAQKIFIGNVEASVEPFYEWALAK